MRRTSTKVEGSGPGKLFIGGLSMQTNEKTLKALFGKFGPLTEVLLKKDRETNKSRGFAFITFDSCEDAVDAEKHTNGKSVDGKTIKVVQAKEPSFQSGGRQWSPLTSRDRGGARSLQRGRGASGEARGHPLGGKHLGDGGCAPNLNLSSSRGCSPFQRGPRSRIGDPLPKIPAPSASRQRSPGMGRQVSRDRDNNGDAPCSEPVYSQKGDYRLSRGDACPTNYSYPRRDYLRPRDTRHDLVYGYKGSWDDRYPRRCSGHDGYGGDRDRATSGSGNGGSYRDSYGHSGHWCAAAPAGRPRLMSGGSRAYIDRCSSRHTDCERGHDHHLSSGHDRCSKGREHGSSCDRRISPPMWQGTPFHRESCRSSNKRALCMDSWGS